MQNKETTSRGIRAEDYVTIVQQACDKVNGFDKLYADLERHINVGGKSKSTLTNYGRHLAHLALHYNLLPTELDQEQVLDYLHLVKSNGSPSATFFKFTVYGMRTACKMRDLPYTQFSLPSIERPQKLPTVLNDIEVKKLLSVCTLLKHRLIIAVCYDCGLRCAEVRNLKVGDIDMERMQLRVRLGKGGKDRILPICKLLKRGLQDYISSQRPQVYLFEGNNCDALSQRGTQWALSQAVCPA